MATQIKLQNKEKKAQISYESNMDAQGFGDTFTTGFYQTATSGFKATGYMGGTVRSTQSFKVNNKENKVTRGSIVDNV